MTKTHWKKLTNPNYFGSWDIDGDSIEVEITSVAQDIVVSSTGEKEECIIAQLKNHKPLILNKTNCKTIAKIFESNYIEDWTNKKIVLVIEKVRAFGSVVDAVRVKPIKVVSSKPILTSGSSKWPDAIAAVKSGKCDIALITKKFQINDADIALLRKETNA